MSTNFTAPNIKYLCQKHGISPRELAVKIGMDPSTIYRLTDDDNPRTPQLRTLRNIADFFKVDPHLIANTDLTAFCGVIPQSDIEPPVEPKAKKEPRLVAAPTATAKLIPLIRITNPYDFDPGIASIWATELHEINENEVSSDFFGFIIEKWIYAPYGVDGDDLVAIEVQSSAMSPTLEKGDIAVIAGFEKCVFNTEKLGLEENSIVIGKVRLNGKDAIVIRRTVQDENGDTLLTAENPVWPSEDINVSFLFGKVVGVSRQL